MPISSFLHNLFISETPLSLKQYLGYLLALVAIFGIATYMAFLSVDLLAYLNPSLNETRWNMLIDVLFTVTGHYFLLVLTLRRIQLQPPQVWWLAIPGVNILLILYLIIRR